MAKEHGEGLEGVPIKYGERLIDQRPADLYEWLDTSTAKIQVLEAEVGTLRTERDAQ